MLATDEGLMPEPPSGTMGHWRAPFHAPGFRPYAVAYAGSSFSWALSAVVFAWVTLVVTTDPLAVGAIFAIRFVALLLFGIPAGVLADRVDRRRMLVAVSLGGAGVGALLAGLAWIEGGSLPLWVLLGGSFLMGTLDAGRIAAATTYAFDLVGPLLATSGIAIANLLAQTMGIFGNLIGGALLGGFGLVVALGVMTLGQLFSAAVLGLSRGHTHRTGERPRVAPAGLRTSLTLLRRDRLLALLFLTVVMVEVLGFSSMTLVPVFARDVFGAGPDAYGIMNAVRGLGGVIGLLVVIRLGLRVTRGTALMAFDALFGLALVVFALSPGFLVALLPLLVVGAAAAGADSLSQSLMQRATTDAERGAAMGIWAFAIGFGPLGHLVAGAAAGHFGAQATQVVFGMALVGMSVLLVLQPLVRDLGTHDPAALQELDVSRTGKPTVN
jgi:MFS family permease